MEEKEKPVEEGEVTAEDANAEILHHSVTVTESVEQNGDGEPPVHIVETRECVVETVEPEPDYPRIVAEKDARIAELEGQIAELSQMKAEYEQMKAAQAAAELAAKQAKARAFAQKQGLNVEATEVAELVGACCNITIHEYDQGDSKKSDNFTPKGRMILEYGQTINIKPLKFNQ